jgi:ketosteroid isomerase-like protein
VSQENLDRERRAFAAWNAGDMDAFGDLYDPHVVVRWAEGWPEGLEPIMGRESVLRQWEQQRGSFDADTAEMVKIVDLGDRVVVSLIWHAVGRGPDLNIETTYVATVREGKTILVEYFWNHQEALKAMGLTAEGSGLTEEDAEADEKRLDGLAADVPAVERELREQEDDA